MQPDLPFTHFAPASDEQSRGTLLLVYGGSGKPNFRHKTRLLAEPIALLGFRVIAFDYRSNTEGANFYAFGIHDRIEDTKRAIEHMKVLGEPPFSILGLSMGGHIAVRAVAETDDGNLFENVILIAPAAYPEEATKPGVLFGREPGMLQSIIKQPDGKAWLTTDAFRSAEKINANLLVVKYLEDKIIPRDVPGLYYRSFGSTLKKSSKWHKKIIDLPGEHQGTLTDPKRIGLLVEEIDSFTAIMATAAR